MQCIERVIIGMSKILQISINHPLLKLFLNSSLGYSKYRLTTRFKLFLFKMSIRQNKESYIENNL